MRLYVYVALPPILNFVAQGEGLLRQWVVGGRIVMAAVESGNVERLIADVAAAVRFQTASDAYSTGSAHFAANSTDDAHEYRISAENNIQLAGFIAFCCSLVFGIENRYSKPHICSSRAQNGCSEMFN